MKRTILLAMAAILTFPPFLFARDNPVEVRERLKNAGITMQEALDISEDIPRDLLDKAHCVIVMPSVIKGAFIIGGSYGRGTMVCRTGKDFSGSWGKPAMMALEGGSLGFQLGGQATDYVFLVMNSRGVNSFLNSKVKLGADVSVAAGPVGRTAAANTDAAFRAEILTYSRSRGAFAGISLEGSTLRPDNGANHDLYGRSVTATEIINGSEVEMPNAAHDLVAVLQKASPTIKTS